MQGVGGNTKADLHVILEKSLKVQLCPRELTFTYKQSSKEDVAFLNDNVENSWRKRESIVGEVKMVVLSVVLGGQKADL